MIRKIAAMAAITVAGVLGVGSHAALAGAAPAHRTAAAGPSAQWPCIK
jgi:hypothetical protein